MRILDRYIVREIFRHAFLGLIVFTFVLFVPQLIRLMELLVRHSGSGAQIARLFLYIVPGVLIFTIPMAVLVGVLLGLGRMSADSEIIALTALGVSRQRMLVPVAVLALTGAVATATLTLWLGPSAFRSLRNIEADLLASQASFQVQPRVFDERFPRTVLYINDISASGTQWHGVFLAEVGEESGSQLTLAENAIVIAEPKQGKLELHLQGGTTHEVSRQDPDHYSLTDFGQSDMPIEVSGIVPTQQRALSNPERRSLDLLYERGPNWPRSTRGVSSPAGVSVCVSGVCAGGGAARIATSARRSRCGDGALRAADRLVLLTVRNWCGACARGQAECGPGDLAGEHRVDSAWAGVAASHGAARRRQQVAETNHAIGVVEALAAPEKGSGSAKGGGDRTRDEWRKRAGANFRRKFPTVDGFVPPAEIFLIFRDDDADVRGAV
jgi:lipopolysaccharide export LptBFGC system permease protein LptF